MIRFEDSALPPLALSIAEACKASGLGRTTIFAAIKAGQLRAIKAGGRTLIKLEDLRAFLDGLPAAGGRAA